MHSPLASFHATLKEKGYRLTLQRTAVHEALQEGKRHPTADDVHAHLSRKYPIIGLSTVYNTLETFCEMGLVRRVTIDGGGARYDIQIEPHGHLVCMGCGQISNTDGISCDSCIRRIDQLCGFQVNDYEAIFSGYCAKCQPAKQGSGQKKPN